MSQVVIADTLTSDTVITYTVTAANPKAVYSRNLYVIDVESFTEATARSTWTATVNWQTMNGVNVALASVTANNTTGATVIAATGGLYSALTEAILPQPSPHNVVLTRTAGTSEMTAKVYMFPVS